MKRILIIEDEPLLAQVYRNKLLRRGFQAEVAVDGQSGLEKINAYNPDLVLLDIMLPKMDGIEVLRSVRAASATRNLPVVVYSNAFSSNASEEARQLGASHLLSKSETRPNEVLDIIAGLLKENSIIEKPAELSAEENETRNCLIAARKAPSEMRQMLTDFFKQNDTAIIAELQNRARVFGGNASLAGLPTATHLAAALEILLQTLFEHPQYINFSTDKTVLQAIECLEILVNAPASQAAPQVPLILVVDDQDISLHAATMALQRAKLRALCTNDPEEALASLEHRSFDLVLLDIDMPKMDGMTLCMNMRTLPLHKFTPVVFFSQLSEIEHRMASTVVGGNDFIGKPFLSIELAVKALVWVSRPRPSNE